MTLYTKDGAEPQPLPQFDYDSNCDMWTDLENNKDGRNACGWSEAPDAPSYDPDSHHLAWSGGAWLITPYTAEELAQRAATARQAKGAELAAYRYERQQVMTFGARQALADDVTIGRITARVTLADKLGLPPSTKGTWKFAEGDYAELSITDLIGYGAAIAQHVQACFDREQVLYAELQASTDPASIDITTGWPA